MLFFIVRTISIVVMAIPLYLALRRPWRFKDKREIALGIFAIYLVCLFSLTLYGVYSNPVDMIKSAVYRVQNRDMINMTPFKSILGFFDWGSLDEILVNNISNVVIFVPLGFFLPFLWEKFRKPIVLLPSCLFVTVFIESFQLFIYRNSDIDDVILNFIGSMLGAGIYLIYCLISKRKIPTD